MPRHTSQGKAYQYSYLARWGFTTTTVSDMLLIILLMMDGATALGWPRRVIGIPPASDVTPQLRSAASATRTSEKVPIAVH